jgi:hypothetical protein
MGLSSRAQGAVKKKKKNYKTTQLITDLQVKPILCCGAREVTNSIGQEGWEVKKGWEDERRKEHNRHDLIVHLPLAAPHLYPHICLSQFLEPFLDHCAYRLYHLNPRVTIYDRLYKPLRVVYLICLRENSTGI